MKRHLVLISLLLLHVCSFIAVCQDNDSILIKYSSDPDNTYRIDSVLSEIPSNLPVLMGDAILPHTNNQEEALYAGFILKSATVSVLDDSYSDHGYFAPHIRSIRISGSRSRMYVTARVYGNCCDSFLFDLSLEEDSTLNLIYYTYAPEVCACVSALQLNFTIEIDETYFPVDPAKQCLNGICCVKLNGKSKTKKCLP